MQITVNADAASRIVGLVEEGEFSSADEVVHFALEAFLATEQERAAKLAMFNEELDRRMAAADRGETISGEEFERWLEDRIAAQEQKAEHARV